MAKGFKIEYCELGNSYDVGGEWNENEVTESENNFTAFCLIFDAQFTPQLPWYHPLVSSKLTRCIVEYELRLSRGRCRGRHGNGL